jgi:hypothetical protein
MDKFDFKKAIKNNIAASQEEKKRYTLNEARITRNIVANNLSLVESLSLLSEREVLMEQLLTEGEEILSEDFDLLNEGLWDKIKSYASKNVFSPEDRFTATPEERKKMAVQYQRMMEKTADGLLKKFMDKFEKQYPGFPNSKSAQEFQLGLLDIATFYDSLKHITLTPDDVENQPISIVQKDIKKGKLDPKQANAIIADLRAVMQKFIDYDLRPLYKKLNEEPAIAAGPGDDLLDRTQGGDSRSMKRQKSLKLPSILGLLGANSNLLGILITMGWFKDLFTQVVKNFSIETVKKVATQVKDTINVEPGEGVTQFLNRVGELTGHNFNLNPNSTVADLKDAMEKTGITPDSLSKATKDSQAAQEWMTDWDKSVENVANPDTTSLGDAFGDGGLGQNGDLGLELDGEVIANQIVDTFETVFTPGSTDVVQGVLPTTPGAAAVTMAAMGAGLAAAGIVSFVTRQKAQKNSRLQKLEDLRKELKDLPVPEVLKPIDEIPAEPEPKVPAADDFKIGDWVKYTNEDGEKMLVRVLKPPYNPEELQEADGPRGQGKYFQADIMINLDTDRVSFSGPYALETSRLKELEKAEDNFVEETKASNPKIQRAIDKVEARKSKEDAEKPSDEEAAEQGEESEEGTEQGEKSEEESAEDAATELVDDNATRIARALLSDDDEEINSTLRNNFRNFFKSQGIVIKKPEDVDKIIRIMKKVISNDTVKRNIAKIANKNKADQSDNKNESKNYLKKVMTESIKAYTRHENSKQLKS